MRKLGTYIKWIGSFFRIVPLEKWFARSTIFPLLKMNVTSSNH